MKKILFLILVVFAIGCNDDNSSDATPVMPKPISEVYYDSADNPDSLQVMATNRNGEKMFFYGGFEDDGKMKQFKSIVYRPAASNYDLKVVFDEAMQVKYVCSSQNQVMDPTVIKFDYNVDQTVTVSLYEHNWQTQKDSLLDQALLEKNANNWEIKERASLATRTASQSGANLLNDAALMDKTVQTMIPPAGADNFNQFAAGLVLGVAGTIAANAQLTVLFGVAGYLFCATNPIGCAGFGALVGFLLSVSTNHANASEVTQSPVPPSGQTPSNPSTDLSGNQLPELSLKISNASQYPIRLPYQTDCAGYVRFSFKCSQNHWNSTLNCPTIRFGNTEIPVKGALLKNITSNWGFNSYQCLNTDISFFDVTTANGIVSGTGQVSGDYGPCTGPVSDAYFTSFNFALIYTGMTGNMILNTASAIVGSNYINAHQ